MLIQHQQQQLQHQPPGATAEAAAKCFSSAMLIEFIGGSLLQKWSESCDPRSMVATSIASMCTLNYMTYITFTSAFSTSVKGRIDLIVLRYRFDIS